MTQMSLRNGLLRGSHALPLFVVLAVLLSACGKSEPEPANESPSVAEPVDAREFFDDLVQAELAQKSYYYETTVSGENASTLTGRIILGERLSDVAQVEETTRTINGEVIIARQILVDGVYYSRINTVTGEKYVVNHLAASHDRRMSELAPKDWEPVIPAITSITNEGDGGPLDGVNTTMYVISIDRSLVNSGSDTSAVTAKRPNMKTSTIWVGPDGLIRRHMTNVNGFIEDHRWFDWNEPITITAPSADEITEDWTIDDLR